MTTENRNNLVAETLGEAFELDIRVSLLAFPGEDNYPSILTGVSGRKSI